MATRFATATGNWSNTTIWDNGALPVAGDTIYPNGFTVTIDQDINVASLNNNVSNVLIPNIATPAMTSNTQPTGTVFANVGAITPWGAFSQDNITSNYVSGSTTGLGVLGYQFTTGKIIKRYILRLSGINQNLFPKTWVFQGSNDGSVWADLDIVNNYITNANYTSGLLANTTSYTYYRLNITAVFNAGGYQINIGEFEMTESTTASPVYGTVTGGSFAVPSTLSGIRNIVQNGAGIVSNNANTVITTAHTSGNTVNFNVASGGFILSQNNQTADRDLAIISINGTGTVNFNSDIWGSQTLAYNRTGAFYINANATVNIYGNIYAPKGGSAAQTYFIALAGSVSNSAVLNITGNVGASGTFANVWTIYAQSLGTTNITGSLTSDLGVCYYSAVGSILNIPTGIVTVTNLNSNPAIIMTSNASLLTINSPIINKVNVNACVAAKMRFYSTGTPYWVFQNNLNADITLAYGSATGAYPNEGDVRFGTTYAASPTRTGTLRVPLPQYVSQGVLTDNTVGTAYLSASDVWNVLTSTITTSGSIGERLKNASTVQTTGDQIASYQV